MLFQRTEKYTDGIKEIKSDRKGRKCSLQGTGGPASPMDGRSGGSAEKASFRASFIRKASLAVETALVLPLFLSGYDHADLLYGYLYAPDTASP